LVHRLGEGGVPAEQVPQMFFRPGQLLLDPAKLAASKVCKLQFTFLDGLKEAASKDNHWQAIRQSVGEKKTRIDAALSLSERLIFNKNYWYVLEGRHLRQEIFFQNYHIRNDGQSAQFMTANKIKVNLYWPNMHQNIEEYVRSCGRCQRNKTACYKN